tara:strand:- start:5140 stop:5916 length:777 start_codon:yes stop_codon:yes gene_type:complete
MSSSPKNNIQNIESYNSHISENYFDIFNKYILITIDYLKHCHDNMCIQNENYRKYIIKQGAKTIKHVFFMLLIYTKNLEITCYNCQKAYVYYIEFIGQITEDNHSFLQLNSKDASLFVYKKTIFDINIDIQKNYLSQSSDYNKIQTVDKLIEIYNLITFKLIDDKNLIDIIKIINIDLKKIIIKIIKILNENNNLEYLNKIIVFLKQYSDDNLIENLELFIKKLKKINLSNNLALQLIEKNVNYNTCNKESSKIFNSS